MINRSLHFYCTPSGYYFPKIVDLKGGGSVDMAPGPLIPYGADEDLLSILNEKLNNPSPIVDLTIDQALKKAEPIFKPAGFRSRAALDKGSAAVSALLSSKGLTIFYRPLGASKDVWIEEEIQGNDAVAVFDWIRSNKVKLLGQSGI